MTYNDLIEKLMKLTPEQRQKQALYMSYNIDEVYHIRLVKYNDYVVNTDKNGEEVYHPDQFVIMYDSSNKEEKLC